MNLQYALFASFSGKHIVGTVGLVGGVGLSNEEKILMKWFVSIFLIKKFCFSFKKFLLKKLILKTKI